ncbi:hypothetical protein ACFFQW_37870 [Umezawaea endophytica]|uniref:Uncharacterized protein n=1 Tax=Umezawaea endophytica TaxID=1654476 RepID=A0A9X2VX29_9PSEU|nr:hypothetical protein [Umezawaea endophytica]MCS7483263.1 hypothetical protein [Umezawaea endophytica]
MEWLKAPVGPGAASRVTRVGMVNVLVVVPHVVAGTRLVDVLPLLADHRVQVVFTVPDWDGTWHGTEEFVRGLGGVVLPWRQAVAIRFDLVVAASHRGVDRVRGPVLVLPHGVGAMKSRTRPWRSHGLAREALVRDGRVVATAIVLSHEAELAVLRESCPEAVPAAVVAGDVCLDRMVASLPHREHYRRALGVGPSRTLVTVSSTWTERSVFGGHPDVYRRLLDEADDRYRVAAVLHPNIWSVHGAWQVRAWLADCLRDGLLVIPPEEGWRATLVASDVVIGDHGSTTQYAAAIGRRIALVPFPDVRAGSPADELARRATALDLTRPLLPQLDAATGGHEVIAKSITSRPGAAATVLRLTIHRLLGLEASERDVVVEPVPLPRPLDAPLGSGWKPMSPNDFHQTARSTPSTSHRP